MSKLISGRKAILPEAETRKEPRPHWSTFARGARKERGVMNQTETEFFETHIEPLVLTGDIRYWAYEKWSWTLTEKTPDGKPGIRYTADFVTMARDGFFTAYEVKGTGIATTADLNRVKLAAEKIPMPFFVATKQLKRDGGGFKVERY